MPKSEEQIIKEHYSKIGKVGGKISRGGGRPPIDNKKRTPKQKKRRKYYENWKRRQGKPDGSKT